MMRVTLQGVIDRLCERLGIPPVLLDDALSAGLTATHEGDEVQAWIFGDEEGSLVSVGAPVGELPRAPGAEQLLRALLAANLLGRGTAGLSLSVVPGTDEIWLCGALPLRDVDLRALHALFSRVVVQAVSWRRVLVSGPAGG
jgi:hypothetical protein